jgi:hypothetical protein
LNVDVTPPHDAYSDEYDPEGRADFDEHLRTVIPGRKWNGVTYALDQLRFDSGRVKIDCNVGRYFLSLATSEACDMELMRASSMRPNEALGLGELPRRGQVHVRASDPVTDGSGRSSALSVAMVVIMAMKNGGFGVLSAPRSGDVATHRFFNHVAPSGIFSPLDRDRHSLQEEFSVRGNVLREYVEELYSVE